VLLDCGMMTPPVHAVHDALCGGFEPLLFPRSVAVVGGSERNLRRMEGALRDAGRHPRRHPYGRLSEYGKEAIAKREKEVPFGRLGQPEEVASVIAFFASPGGA
jgi:NAD(P)-dependent dehydrogenase (short-subunit alcohol dehydrogenase family)